MAVDLVLHPEGQTDIIGAQRHRRVYTETLRDRDDNYEKKYKIWLTLILSDLVSNIVGKDTRILRFTNILQFSREIHPLNSSA